MARGRRVLDILKKKEKLRCIGHKLCEIAHKIQ